MRGDAALGALLLERISPGTTFVSDSGSVAEVSALISRLHRSPGGPLPAVPTLREQMRSQLGKALERLARLRVMGPDRFERLRRMAHFLSTPSGRDPLLHGDMQPRNILAGSEPYAKTKVTLADRMAGSGYGDNGDGWKAKSLLRNFTLR